MSNHRKKSIRGTLNTVKYLADRTPEMAFTGGAEEAFALVGDYRDGAIYVGYYSGNSEWERHTGADEIVMALEGKTVIVLRVDGRDERIALEANELVIVPCDTWHRFENSEGLKVLTVTPQPTDHRLEDPVA